MSDELQCKVPTVPLQSEAKASNAIVALTGYYAEALATTTSDRDVWCHRAIRAEEVQLQLLKQQEALQLELGEVRKLLTESSVALQCLYNNTETVPDVMGLRERIIEYLGRRTRDRLSRESNG